MIITNELKTSQTSIPKSPVRKCTTACDRCKDKRIRCTGARGRACTSCAGKYQCQYTTKNKKRGPKGKNFRDQVELISQEGDFTFINCFREPKLKSNASLPLENTSISPLSTVDAQLSTLSWPTNTNSLLSSLQNGCYPTNMLTSTASQNLTLNRYYYHEKPEISALNMISSGQYVDFPFPCSNFYNGTVLNSSFPTYHNQEVFLPPDSDTNYLDSIAYSE